MIQDIAPHRYDNRFKRAEPGPSDFALYIKDHQALLAGMGDELRIPVLEELERTFPGCGERAVYLFSIDERPYFLIEEGTEGELPGRPSKPQETGSVPGSSGICLEWKGSQYFRAMEPEYQAFAAVTAIQLWRWRQSRRFCGHCGAEMKDSDTERALVCPVCGQIEYPKIAPAVIVAITNGDKLLMSRYRDRPYRGYALIAGYVEIGETFEETVRREAMEEVGLRVKNIRYFKSQPWAFTDTEMIGFFAELDGDDTIRLEEDELSEAAWYAKDEIPDDESRISVGSEMKLAFKYGRF